MTDIPSYPIVVRRTGIKLYLSVAALLALGLAMAASGYFFFPDIDDWWARLLAAACFTFLPVCSLFTAWSYWKGSIVLNPDRIVKDNGFWSRELRRADILGCRPAGEEKKISLVPKDEAGKSITIPLRLVTRPDTAPWFEGFVDLDFKDAVAAKKRLLEDEKYGPDLETRQRRWGFWNRLSVYLSLPVLAVYLWAMIMPRPYLWAVGSVAAIPVVVLLLEAVSGGMLRFGVEDDKKDARPAIASLLIMPVFLLGWRLYEDWNLLRWQPLFEWSAVLGMVTVAYLILRSETLRASVVGVTFALVLCTAYWVGVLGIANVLFDGGAMDRFPVTVLQKHKDDGTCEMKVGPWGSVTEPSKIEVPKAFYRRYREGDRVCVYRGNGWLGFAWYDLGDC